MDMNHTVTDNAMTVTLRGQFTFSDNNAFRPVIENLKDDALNQAYFDCSGLEFVDSAGLGMLMLCNEVAQKHAVTLSMKLPEGQAGKMFLVSRFDQMFKIMP